MCLSGFRGTSIPVKQGLRELSPERGFKMTLEFYDAFRGVGPIKYFCFAVYKTSKFINMYSGCFEWKRTGSVTGESTQSWPGQIFTQPPNSWICIPVVLNGTEPGLWRWSVHKVDLAKFLRNLHKVIPMHSGWFEWNRTGSVTVESTQIRRVDLAKFLRNLQIFTKPPKSYIWFRLFWMEENRICDGGEYAKLTWPNFTRRSKKTYSNDVYMLHRELFWGRWWPWHDACDWRNQLGPVWEYRSDSRMNV
jgi:hypothetical protein